MKRKIDYMDDERSIWKYIFLGILTLGIYQWWCIYTLLRDMKKLCKDSDTKVDGILKFILLNIVTLGIYGIFWMFKTADILSKEGRNRGVDIDIKPTFMIICYVLSYISGWTVYVAWAQIFNAMNKLAADYNRRVRTMPPSYFENNAEVTN